MKPMASHTSSPEHESPPAPRSARVLAGLLGLMGVGHFVATDFYALIVPRVLPAPRALVLVSGVAELACAALLASKRTHRAGAWSAFALFLAVWPANVQMALDGGAPGREGLLGSPVVAWLRVPLQVPLLYWTYRIASPRPSKDPGVHDPA
ncbi:MAG: DoxX family protein [Egibacteraceae bacterium]